MKFSVIIFSLLFCLLACNTSKTVALQKTNPEDLDTLIGEWTGTLTYIDYRSNEPYTMPADVNIKKGKSENKFILDNIYPNEPKANNTDKLVLSKDGNKINNYPIVSSTELPDGVIQIKTEHAGKDNNQKALIQNIITISQDKFINAKYVKFENSEEWIKRSEFNYRRKNL